MRRGWVLLVLALLLGWGGTAATLSMRGLAHPMGLAAHLGFLTTPAAVGGITLGMVLAGVLVITDRQRWRVAALWSAGLVLLGLLELSVYPDHRNDGHGDILPGAALLAWVIGARRGDARAGVDAACGAAAAAYLWAGVSKLQAGGLLWGHDGSLSLLIAERAVIGPAALRGLREAVAHSPALSAGMASAALLIELCGPLFLWPRLRRGFALAAVALHVGVAALMGYVYVEWCLTLLALVRLTTHTTQATQSTLPTHTNRSRRPEGLRRSMATKRPASS